ncbi:DUF1376 domain-containing protein [Methylobacterium sp. 1973]|uniref:DUF1376 domain-containing protein n=1 Tax=Methylobacterium sp. 1973 TaxID=3156421 RepID=UPI00339AE5C8
MKGEFYKMDFRAWDHGTVDLSLEQEAAYLRLCHAMYGVGGPVPNSPRFLMGIFRCGNVKAASLVRQLIEARKIAVTADGRLFNHRVSEELQAREKVAAVRREAGQKGGSAPRVTPECTPSDPRVHPEWMSSDARLNASKSLKNNNTDKANASTPRSREEKRREEPPKAPTGGLDRFEEFRSAYPKRNTAFPTTAARKRWNEAIRKGADPAAIIVGARAYAVEQTRISKVGTEYVKTADVWLNQQRWRDFSERPALAEPRSPDAPDPYLASLSDDRWRTEVSRWRDRVGYWPLKARTPPPDDPRTAVPKHILAEMNLLPDRARAA